MRIRIISAKENEEATKHPAKWFIGVPLSSVVTEGMAPEDLKWLMDWRAKVAAFVESDDATSQAKLVQEAYATAQREEAKLRKMCDDVAGPDGHAFPTARKQKELEAKQQAESGNAS